jgi:uncharacterized protein YndB with AHSA1/START domain
MVSTSAGQSLEVRRNIAAPPAAVYDAWTKPEILTRWFSPSTDHSVIVHQAESRVGGRYRIEMRHTSGKSHIAIGEYRELERPDRLSFTWQWEGSPMAETLVTVEFRDNARGGTELVLVHTNFATEAERDGHNAGWAGCLARLEVLPLTN